MDIDKFTDENFRGCISVYKKGKTILQKSSGYADLANKVGNTVDTKFATASAGKVFVAVGILQLVENGLLNLDDEIGGLLDLDLKEIDKGITVEQLLTHTSGMPDYFDESVMDDYEQLWRDFPNYRIRSNSDLLPLFIDKPMTHRPGAEFRYNNSGFVMLALIIEKMTGKDFDVFLQENVFLPCGMTDTGYYELDRLPAKCAANYIHDKTTGLYRTNIYSVDAKGTGAGGAFITVKDIKRFWNGLLSGELISGDMLENMLTNHVPGEECYGYGIWLKKTGKGWMPYFQGCDPGVSFVSSYDLDEDLMMVLVSNYGDNVWEIWRDLNKRSWS